MLNRSPLTTTLSMSVMCLISYGLVLLFSAFLLQVGIQAVYIGILMLTFIFGTYIFSGMFGKTMRLGEFLNTAKHASPYHGGQSLAAGLISSGVFIFLAGQIYQDGTNALAGFSGWVLGACLMVVLFATPVNRTDRPTLSGLLVSGENGKGLRLIALVVILAVSAPLLMMQFEMAAYIGNVFLGMSRDNSIIIMSVAICLCLLLGGIQSLSIIRTLAYPVIAIAFLTPVILIAYKITGNPFPQFAYGIGALQPIAEIDREIFETGFAETDNLFSLTKNHGSDLLGYIATLLCIALGTSCMPHLLQHFSTLKTSEQAQKAGIWGVVLFLLVLTAIPAFAAFYKINIYTSLLGLQLSDLEVEAPWIFSVSGEASFNAIAICGEYVASYDQVLRACGGDAEYFLSSKDITVNPSLLVLSTAILNELPYMTTWLLVTGALIAIWSTADGLVFAIANTFCHDGYANVIRPNAPQSMRLFIIRFLLIFTVAMFAIFTLGISPDPQVMFESSFALATAALFPALLISVWTKDATNRELSYGMAVGLLVCLTLLVLAVIGFDGASNSGDELKLTFDASVEKPTLMTAGLIGMLSSFASIYFIKMLAKYRTSTAKEKRDVSSKPKTV